MTCDDLRRPACGRAFTHRPVFTGSAAGSVVESADSIAESADSAADFVIVG